MGIDCQQLKDVVINPALTALGMNTPSAICLLLGTAAQESGMGNYIKQIGGPAYGIFQMEIQSYERIWGNLIFPNVALRAKIRLLLGYTNKPPASRMASDLMLATIMTRLFYYMVKKPLPEENDITGIAAYWKTYYNSKLGAGTEQEFIKNYERYVK
jgi:hypothetical protein